MATNAKTDEPVATLRIVRRVLLGLLVFGILGTLAELLLLEHTDGFWQQAPLYVMGASLVVLAWHAAAPSRASLRALQAMMVLFMAGGVAGLVLHYLGNVEFERELRPGLSGRDLFQRAITGATPALAPGTMVLLGLLGLAYTYRQPTSSPRTREE